VFTKTEWPSGVRNVDVTFIPVANPKIFAVPTATWTFADEGGTTIVAPKGEALLPPQPATKKVAGSAAALIKREMCKLGTLLTARIYRPSW